jgi:hypothetical protein
MVDYAFVSVVYGSQIGDAASKSKLKTARKSGGKEQDDFARRHNYDMSIEPPANPLLPKQAPVAAPEAPVIPPSYEVRPVQYGYNGAHGAHFGSPAEWQTPPPQQDPHGLCHYCPHCGGCKRRMRPRNRRSRRRRDTNDLMQKVLMSVAFACFAIYVVETFVKRSSR